MSLVTKGNSFLVENGRFISKLESYLKVMAWVLPSRFKDAELVSELIVACLDVIGYYYNSVTNEMLRVEKSLSSISAHIRYMSAWIRKDSRYKWISRLLGLLQCTGLLLEMFLSRRVSKKTRWRVVLFLELIKATLRLIVIRITQRPYLAVTTATEDNTSSEDDDITHTEAPYSLPPNVLYMEKIRIPVETSFKYTFSSIPDDDSQFFLRFLFPKALTIESVMNPTRLMDTFLSYRDWISEVLYVIIPPVYIVASNRLGDSKGEYLDPLLFPLALEFFSRVLRRRTPSSHTVERSIYNRRDRELLWYFLRGSIWESFTRPSLQSLSSTMEKLHFLSFVGLLIKDWVTFVDQYYYYAAL